LNILCKTNCAATERLEPNRIWGDKKCSKSDIVINQGSTAPLPSGIPTYTVEIMNMCVSGCDISAIHLRCGWFSSARLINPKLFKRLRYNDCLVNDGRPLVNGGTVSFQYANTYLYPLSVSSVVCVWRVFFGTDSFGLVYIHITYYRYDHFHVTRDEWIYIWKVTMRTGILCLLQFFWW